MTCTLYVQMRETAMVNFYEGDGSTPIVTNVKSPGFGSPVTSASSSTVVQFLGGEGFSSWDGIGFKVRRFSKHLHILLNVAHCFILNRSG